MQFVLLSLPWYIIKKSSQIQTQREDFEPISSNSQLCRLTEWPHFLLRVFGNRRLGRRQQALTKSCHCTETYPQTLACGFPFEGACLFLTFLVDSPWERWIPSSRSKVCVQTAWNDAEDKNHFVAIQLRDKVINRLSTQNNALAAVSNVLPWRLEVRNIFALCSGKHGLGHAKLRLVLKDTPASWIAHRSASSAACTPELTGNMAYLCHSSNWNRATLIDRAGCNAIKT